MMAPGGLVSSPGSVAFGIGATIASPKDPSTNPPRHPSGASTITCPRCGTPTPTGFAYCQQCGLHMSAIAPTDPGASLPARVRPPTNARPTRPISGRRCRAIGSRE
jgi:hypothetical protein